VGNKAPKKTTTINKTEAPAWLQAPLQNVTNRAESVFNQPYTPYQGARVAPLQAAQLQAQDMTLARAGAGSPEISAARAYNADVLSGSGFRGTQNNPYLGAQNAYTGATNRFANVSNPLMGENPYLNDMIGRAQRDVSQEYTRAVAPGTASMANYANAFGGSAHTELMGRDRENLARSLGDVSTQLRGADYQNSQQLVAQDLARRGSLTGEDLSRNSSLYGADLGRNANIADTDINREQTAYENERARQQAAAQFAPELQQAGYRDIAAVSGIGAQQQGQAQNEINAAMQAHGEAQGYNQQQLAAYADLLARLQGGQSTSTTTGPGAPRPSNVATVLG
jgi:hypothetical protein